MACMLRIPVVTKFGNDHIENAVLMISALIFLENVEGMKLKFGEEIEQHHLLLLPVRRDFQ